MTGESARHWDDRYDAVGSTEVSWFSPEPHASLAMFDAVGVDPARSVIDVGGGASMLVDRLVDRGFGDVTVLDVSEVALAEARTRVDAPSAHWIRADLLKWRPSRRWDVWHDRAVFHFLTDAADRARYREQLSTAVTPGGVVIVGTFAEDGPEYCSGLPVRRYAPDELVRELGYDPDDATVRREIHRTPSGADQAFTWIAVRTTGG